ncbi:universal stress protein [Halorubrum sp. SD626R]|uniref:universal stress protein n=1 Tax=Halorubrum sp. SD626R TaxID=1419722 RepID=UPI000B2237BF|nr:universal stress protein [Halorubrum sp. SD626R]TKX79994.1 universal stress protein [Halorubrum sp. SD626R]
MYDDILFPTDGSEASKATFPHAVSQARAFDARIHVLYVVDTTYAGVGAGGNKNVNSLRAEGEAVVAEFEERLLDEAVEVVPEIAEGDPFTQIKRYGDDGIDMIVMGTRGRSGVEKHLLGSVTEKVVRTADVPVFTVRTPE